MISEVRNRFMLLIFLFLMHFIHAWNEEQNPKLYPVARKQANQSNEVGRWEHWNLNKPFPPNMVQAGVDLNGALIYVGRASHEGDILPAKVVPDRKVAYVSYGGKEFRKDDFEVLRFGEYEWKFAKGGSVPETAVRIGQTRYNEPLYMGRAFYKGTQTPGKVHPSKHCCYLPFGGKEVKITEYDVLCTK